jgi:hypothetical protein
MIITACALALLPCVFTEPVQAQAVWGKVGTSSLMEASGFEMNYKWAPVQGWLGMGVSDSFNLGGYLQTRVYRSDVGFGDRYLPFVLSTDEFETSRYFSGRGIFAHRDFENGSWTAFAGATSSEISYSFYRSFATGDPTAGFSFQRRLTDRLRFQSFNIVQQKITSLQDFGFKLNDNLDLGLSAGIGNNAHYVSTGATFNYRRLRLLGSYTSAGDSFLRVSGVSTMAPERTGANLRAYYQPWRRLQLTGSHENLLSPALRSGEVPVKISLDGASASAQLWQTHFGGSVSTSTSGPLRTTTESYSISRNLTQRISVSGSAFRFHNTDGLSKTWVASVTENISPRLNLYQGFNHAGNANNVVWGLQLLTNRLTFGIENTTIYSPLAGGFGGKQYMQAWSFNLSTSLTRGIRLHTNTYMDFEGKTRYTAWADGIGFARNGETLPNAAPVANSLGAFLVKGRVIDTEGKPLWGIAIQVDGRQTYSDSSGRFLLHFRKGQTYPVAVLLDRSLNRNNYEVVEAPVTATAESEEISSEITIVLRAAIASPR